MGRGGYGTRLGRPRPVPALQLRLRDDARHAQAGVGVRVFDLVILLPVAARARGLHDDSLLADERAVLVVDVPYRVALLEPLHDGLLRDGRGARDFTRRCLCGHGGGRWRALGGLRRGRLGPKDVPVELPGLSEVLDELRELDGRLDAERGFKLPVVDRGNVIPVHLHRPAVAVRVGVPDVVRAVAVVGHYLARNVTLFRGMEKHHRVAGLRGRCGLRLLGPEALERAPDDAVGVSDEILPRREIGPEFAHRHRVRVRTEVLREELLDVLTFGNVERGGDATLRAQLVLPGRERRQPIVAVHVAG